MGRARRLSKAACWLLLPGHHNGACMKAPKQANLLLELDVDEVRLRAVGLPVRVVAPVAQQVHAVAWFGARHRPHRQAADLAPRARVRQPGLHHHCAWGVEHCIRHGKSRRCGSA
jgi:hypothetical protein